MCVWPCAYKFVCPQKLEALDPPEAEAKGDWEPSDMGTED